MPVTQSRPYLAAILGFLHQARAEGELVLEQNDGTRRFYLKDGDLCYLRSDAVGEQFGNYLIRLGVLDYSALKDLLAEDGARVGDRVVQWGLLTEEQRDARLRELFGNILLHAVEHPVLSLAWHPGDTGSALGRDLQFHLDHRRLVWDVYRQMQTLDALVEKFESEEGWRWRAQGDLLEGVADLTLTPQLAFAISQLGREPMGFTTLVSVTGLGEPETARLLAALWALGGLELADGDVSSFKDVMPPPPPKAAKAAAQAEPQPESAPTPPGPPDVEPIEMAVPEPPAAPPEPPAPLPDTVGGSEPSPAAKARGLFLQAESLQAQGRTSEAIRALEQSVKLDPETPRSFDAWMLLGDLRQGNPAWSTRAIEAYQVAARVQPRRGEPWLCMGQLYRRKGFETNATGCFRKAMDLDPSLEIPDLGAAEEPGAGPREGLFGKLRGFLGGERR
ncbi:MAG TPA: tetratricopeptide repeat protein [Holophagaceae bacterium]|nr:tetratricopeptide repeat protein [Holophagaceae bacterium]